mmetsp:Transcript_10222/g.23003  ORF Transcript_10222/g.23003 Transcript_10222/m.23003 type:complete len:241 (+) Transcript_10222:415-1137(+)
MRIGMHETGENEGGDASLHGHVHHLSSLGRIGDLLERPALDPLQCEHAGLSALAGELWQPMRCSDEGKEAMLPEEQFGIGRLVMIVELLENSGRHLVGALGNLCGTSPVDVEDGQAQGPAGPVQGNLPQCTRPLDLNSHVVAIQSGSTVDLTERGRRHRAFLEVCKERCPQGIAARSSESAGGQWPSMPEILQNDPECHVVGEGRILLLQLLQRIGSLIAYQVWPLRERLPDLHENRAEV